MLADGNPLGPAAILRQLHPSRGTFTGVVDVEIGPNLIGQFSYDQGDRSARFTFVLPEAAIDLNRFPLLVQGMAMLAGDWGALCLLGEVPEDGLLYDRMRQSGFAVYGWQRVWKAH